MQTLDGFLPREHGPLSQLTQLLLSYKLIDADILNLIPHLVVVSVLVVTHSSVSRVASFLRSVRFHMCQVMGIGVCKLYKSIS